MFKDAQDHLREMEKRRERARNRALGGDAKQRTTDADADNSGKGLLDSMEQKLRDGSGFRSKRVERATPGFHMGAADLQSLVAGLRRTGAKLS